MGINKQIAEALGYKVEYNSCGYLVTVIGPYHAPALLDYSTNLNDCTVLLKELSINQVNVHFDSTISEWCIEGMGIRLTDPSLPLVICKGFLKLKASIRQPETLIYKKHISSWIDRLFL